MEVKARECTLGQKHRVIICQSSSLDEASPKCCIFFHGPPPSPRPAATTCPSKQFLEVYLRVERSAHASHTVLLGPTSVIHFLGAHEIILRVSGDEDPSQGPWEPGALLVALNLGVQATAGGALQLPFPSL